MGSETVSIPVEDGSGGNYQRPAIPPPNYGGSYNSGDSSGYSPNQYSQKSQEANYQQPYEQQQPYQQPYQQQPYQQQPYQQQPYQQQQPSYQQSSQPAGAFQTLQQKNDWIHQKAQERRHEEQQKFDRLNQNAGAEHDDEKYNYNAPPGPAVGKRTFSESFKMATRGWNDLPFAIFFVCCVAGFVVVAVMAISYYRNNTGYIDGGTSTTMDTNAVKAFAIVIGISVVVSLCALVIATKWPKWFIQAGIILNVVVGVGTSIYYLVKGYKSAGIVFLLFALLFAWCYWSMRARVPFSATMLRIVLQVARKYKSVYVVAIIGIIFTMAFSYLFAITVVGTYARWGNSSNGYYSNSKLIGLLVWDFFAGYYITEVLRTIIHMTISGVYGSWYYLSRSDGGMPSHCALGAFKRAMTNCFGSACFGSLLVTLVELIRQMIRIAQTQFASDGNGWLYFLMVCLDALTWLVDFLIRYFNRYAFSYVALYGKPYMKSAKDTYHIFKFKGWDALINDCLIDSGVGMYSCFSGYISAFAAYMYIRHTRPAYNYGGGYTAPIVAFSFVISAQVCNVITTVITSGVATFFVCLAKDPEIYQMCYPEDFQEIFQNYPQVLMKIQMPPDTQEV